MWVRFLYIVHFHLIDYWSTSFAFFYTRLIALHLEVKAHRPGGLSLGRVEIFETKDAKTLSPALVRVLSC